MKLAQKLFAFSILSAVIAVICGMITVLWKNAGSNSEISCFYSLVAYIENNPNGIMKHLSTSYSEYYLKKEERLDLLMSAFAAGRIDCKKSGKDIEDFAGKLTIFVSGTNSNPMLTISVQNTVRTVSLNVPLSKLERTY